MTTTEEILNDLVEILLPRSSDQFVLRVNRTEVLQKLNVVLKKNQIDSDAKHIIDDIEAILKIPQLISGFMISYDYFSDNLRIEYVPTVQHLERIIETYEQNIRSNLKARLKKLSPYGFEDLVVEILSEVSWAQNVEVTFRSKDGGIDYIGKYIDPRVNLTFKLVGEAKHWSTPVGVKPIREFIGVLASQDDKSHKIGVYMASGGFTREALKEMSKSPSRILHFDGEQIIDLMLKNKVGIKEFSLEGSVINEQFWKDVDF